MTGFGCCGGMVTMMLLAGLCWILLLVGVGILLYALVTRWQAAPGRTAAGRDDPLALVRIRYARGEITRDQYRQILSDLTKREGDAP